jgi:hypothetical protein
MAQRFVSEEAELKMATHWLAADHGERGAP